MLLARQATALLVDSSCFMNFGRAGNPGHLLELVRYLKEWCNASVVEEVDTELQRLAGLREHRSRRKHPGVAMWPSLRDRPECCSVRLQDTPTVADIVRALRQPKDHSHEHLGEAATIVKAQEISATVILDDQGAKKIAKGHRVPFISTPQLAAQMVIETSLTEAQGLAVYEQATPQTLGDGSAFPAPRYFRSELLRALKAFQEAGIM